MSIFKRIFGKPTTLTHESPNPAHAAPGAELQKYLEEVGVVLGKAVAEIDVTKALAGDYGCDPFDISECAQIAEEIWRVKLLPNPMTQDDLEDLSARFPTLASIIDAAQRMQTAG